MDFSKFSGRREALEKIKRFCDPVTPVMLYRTTVFSHAQHVEWLVEDIITRAKEVYAAFDGEFARALALVHDDIEIVIGDVQLNRKELMTQAGYAELVEREGRAGSDLAKRWPHKVNGYCYGELLSAEHSMDRVEAQVVKYCDKLDALGESLHEVFAGNNYFIVPAKLYVNVRIPKLLTDFPAVAKLCTPNHPLFCPVVLPDIVEVAKKSKPHTAESVKLNSRIPFYERWKEVTIKHAGLKPLVEQKEHLI